MYNDAKFPAWRRETKELFQTTIWLKENSTCFGIIESLTSRCAGLRMNVCLVEVWNYECIGYKIQKFDHSLVFLCNWCIFISVLIHCMRGGYLESLAWVWLGEREPKSPTTVVKTQKEACKKTVFPYCELFAEEIVRGEEVITNNSSCTQVSPCLNCVIKEEAINVSSRESVDWRTGNFGELQVDSRRRAERTMQVTFEVWLTARTTTHHYSTGPAQVSTEPVNNQHLAR